MNGAIYLWLPLLESLDASVGSFADSLLTSMLDVFKYPEEPLIALPTGPSTVDGYSSEFTEAILTWLQHLTSSNPKMRFGRNSSSPVDYDELAKQCVLRPTEWFASRPPSNTGLF